MKGRIDEIIPKTKQDGTTAYWIVIDGEKMWDSRGVFKDKLNQEVEYETAKSKEGTMTFINAPRSLGGIRGKSPEEIALQRKSFAAAYAKDVTVSFIASGMIKASKEADAIVLHYFNLFKGLME